MPVYTLDSVFVGEIVDNGPVYDEDSNSMAPVLGVVTVDTATFPLYQHWIVVGAPGVKVAGNAEFVWGEESADSTSVHAVVDPDYASSNYEDIHSWGAKVFIGLVRSWPQQGDPPDRPTMGGNLGDNALDFSWTHNGGSPSDEAPLVFFAFGGYVPEGGDPVDPPEPTNFWTDLVNARELI